MSAIGAYGNKPAWRKSKYSVNDGACVEVGAIAGVVGVRDSTDRNGSELHCSADVWRFFISLARSTAMSQQLRP
jgi:hypothetical protein